jgi:hypothetical protein
MTTYSQDVTIDVAMSSVGELAAEMVKAIIKAEEGYANLNEAKGGDDAAVWARRLHSLPVAGPNKLTIDATAKTVSCLPGANLFVRFTVGKTVEMSGWTDPANNATGWLVTGIDPDFITFGDSTALIDEVGSGDELVEVEATADETSRTQAMIDAGIALHDIWECANNVAVSQEERMNYWRAVASTARGLT